MSNNNLSIKYNKKDFQSDTSIKWCPGCGDYSIYNAVINAFTKLNTLREDFLIVSGIGCSSRFPYYCQTYGFHTIHGRATTVAMGARIVNPKLSIWVVTGDGDSLSIGGNHFIHVMRKNPDIKIMLFNNQIYGLTKGQYSPTSKKGLKTKTSPFGSVETPLNAISLAVIVGASFIARAVAVDTKHLQSMIIEAGKHKGLALIEILTNCIIFNNNAFHPFEAKSIRNDNIIFLENGKPLTYGKENDKGLILNGLALESVVVNEENKNSLVTHSTEDKNYTLHFLLANLTHPEFPLPIGVLKQTRCVTFNEMLEEHEKMAKEHAKIKNLHDLVNSGDTWIVE
jgi:2-oxoglutarate ferredoxin oxidoreductase subunit beta